jgi:TonB family protein
MKRSCIVITATILMIGITAFSYAIVQSLPCKTQYPLNADKEGKPIWVNSEQLMKRSTHCEAPKFPPLAKHARIDSKVELAILIDPSGSVECINLISGHPMLNTSAFDAAKKWKFKPLKIHGKALGFCGVLVFHFTTSQSDYKADSCLCAHW